MSSLLIQDTPLQVLPKLACMIGLQEAIILQQIHYLSLRASNHDGWVANTLDDWCQVFTFLSRRSIERAFASLRQQRLLRSEPVADGTRRTRRVKVDHDVLDELADLADHGEVNRQIGGTKPPNWRDQTAKLAGPNRQIGGTRLCKGTEEVKAERTTDAASQRSASQLSLDEQTDQVFEAWGVATGNTDSVLDDKRRRIIRKALRSRPNGLADCLDAVRGWRHSAHHAGANADRAPINTIGVLLGDADNLDRFRNLERIRGASDTLVAGSGKVAAHCPGHDISAELAELWAPIAAALADRVPESTHDIFLTPLHPHAEHDGALIVGVPPEIATWVSDRFRRILDAAAGGLQVTLVECTTRLAINTEGSS